MNSLKIHSEIISSIRESVPQKPGVYLFHDKYGNIMYVGKSVNLRNRILSYFRSSNSGIEYRIQQMIFNIRDYTYYETDSELLALLLEDELIKIHLPNYNIRQQEFLQYQYILLTDDLYPTCKMIDRSGVNGQMQIFGPFRDKYFVENILEIIYKFYHVRSCIEPYPIKKCLNFKFNLCTGPCRKNISIPDYAEIIAKVKNFLNGKESLIVNKLTKAMDESSAVRDFEQALEIKSQLSFCKKFCERQRFIHKFKTQTLQIFENGANKSAYFFRRGALKLPDKENTAEKRSNFFQSPSKLLGADEDDRYLLDRANIIFGWMKKRKNDCTFNFE